MLELVYEGPFAFLLDGEGTHRQLLRLHAGPVICIQKYKWLPEYSNLHLCITPNSFNVIISINSTIL
jgi:hypothetical protein